VRPRLPLSDQRSETERKWGHEGNEGKQTGH
jgi:hypothetical protein